MLYGATHHMDLALDKVAMFKSMQTLLMVQVKI